MKHRDQASSGNSQNHPNREVEIENELIIYRIFNRINVSTRTSLPISWNQACVTQRHPRLWGQPCWRILPRPDIAEHLCSCDSSTLRKRWARLFRRSGGRAIFMSCWIVNSDGLGTGQDPALSVGGMPNPESSSAEVFAASKKLSILCCTILMLGGKYNIWFHLRGELLQIFFLVNVLDMQHQFLIHGLLFHVVEKSSNANYGGISSTVAKNTRTLFESATTYPWDKLSPYIPINCAAAYATIQIDQFGYNET